MPESISDPYEAVETYDEDKMAKSPRPPFFSMQKPIVQSVFAALYFQHTFVNSGGRFCTRFCSETEPSANEV
jgi:hypothetical protein